MKKKISIISVFLVLILGISFGVWYINNDNNNDTKNNEISNTNNVIEENIVTEEESVEENPLPDYDVNDLFGKYYEEADKILQTMSIEEKVGQMFLVRYPDENVHSQITKNYPGGYILFAKDFENQTKDSILSEISKNQKNSKIKMFFAVDEEGGSVVRVSNYSAFRSSKFQSPQNLWKQGGIEKILEDSSEKSELLKSIGINMNLAPVVDIPTDTSSFIYSRSLGEDADTTAEYVSELVNKMNDDNMISCLKHFPGYGDNVDTHTGIAVDERDFSVFESEDFKPFEAGINGKAPVIMVNHNIVNCMDTELPASLSKNVHDILRNNLKFTGLIITDDLAMDAVKEYAKNGEAATQAVLAGNDMIISSDFEKQKTEVIDAIDDGKIDEKIVDNAVRRILACKIAYGIIE